MLHAIRPVSGRICFTNRSTQTATTSLFVGCGNLSVVHDGIQDLLSSKPTYGLLTHGGIRFRSEALLKRGALRFRWYPIAFKMNSLYTGCKNLR